MKIGIVSCGVHKKLGFYKAKDLYTSDRFKNDFNEAKRENEKVFIISAKHGLLDPEKRIFTYNKSINNLTTEERVQLVSKLENQIKNIPANSEINLYCFPEYVQLLKPIFGTNYLIREHSPEL